MPHLCPFIHACIIWLCCLPCVRAYAIVTTYIQRCRKYQAPRGRAGRKFALLSCLAGHDCQEISRDTVYTYIHKYKYVYVLIHFSALPRVRMGGCNVQSSRATDRAVHRRGRARCIVGRSRRCIVLCSRASVSALRAVTGARDKGR